MLVPLGWAEALLGHEDECHRYIAEIVELQGRIGGEGKERAIAGMLELGLGRMEEAIPKLEAHVEASGRRVIADAFAPRSVVPSLIEAYVRVGRREEARGTLAVLEAQAKRSGRPSALAPALRCRALLEGAERDFKAALAEHERWGNPFERARTLLCYGERLRREKRRGDARRRLREALDSFVEFGATGWARRAEAELGATGERVRRRVDSTRDDLTPQELVVTRLVAQGLTNREVAAQLFLSTNTIETHLRHVFQKLGVRSRTELAAKFTDFRDSTATPVS
jgi:DNA-binding CsgD family transcriptional regulator